MNRAITYTDAVRILGAGRPTVLKVADQVLGGAILGAAALTGNIGLVQLVDVRSELLARAEPLLKGLGARVRGASGRDRSDLMVAANTVLVVESFFTAFTQAVGEVAATAGLSVRDQLRMAGGTPKVDGELVAALLTVQPPLPTPTRTMEEVAAQLLRYYRGMGHSLVEFLRGLAVWDLLDETRRDYVETLLAQELAATAVSTYQEQFRQLCIDCPEFELWVRHRDAAATRDLIRRLEAESARRDQELREGIGSLHENRRHADWVVRVARSNNGRLEQPIASHGVARSATGPVVPSLRAGFVMPACQVAAERSPSDPIASDDWWDRQPRHADVGLFVHAHLTTPAAMEAPMVLFGRPGSGKSVFLRWLAANLDPHEFLPVMVELRSVPADLDLQSQIEHALRQATGVAMSWPELAEATDAMPVVLLDGFDELLQASFGARSDFLEGVTRFQQREAEQQRPLAVLVTSRTVVADLATYPEDTVTARLAPFGFQEIGAWLRRWNDTNEQYFRDSGRQPLQREEVMVHAALATEPLLLQMLALYDAETGALPRSSADLDVTDLYERLLHLFVEREVRRIPIENQDTGPHAMPDPDRELDRLAVASFAMFNRHRQHASEAEIHEDLVAILGADAYATKPRRDIPDQHLAGQLLVGRFFFIHESLRIERDTQHRSYEFLHATFGEYLIARHVARLVLASGGSDDVLWALLSWAPLTDRLQVVVFLRDLITKWGPSPWDALDVVRAGLIWLPAANSTYKPESAEVAERVAATTANALLVGLSVQPEIDIANVRPPGGRTTDWWRRLAMTWRVTLRPASWATLADTLLAERDVADGEQTLKLRMSLDVRPARRPLDMFWSVKQRGPSRTPVVLHREDLVSDPDIDVLVHTAEDAVVEFPDATAIFGTYDGRLRSLTNILVALRLSSASVQKSVAGIYRSAFAATSRIALGEQSRIRKLLVQQLAADARTMRTEELLDVLEDLIKESEDPPAPALDLSRIVIDAIGKADDIGPLVTVLRELLPRALAMGDEATPLYVALTQAGLDPAAFVSRWASPAAVLEQVDLAGLAQRDPVTAATLLRMVAESGMIDDKLQRAVARALPPLSAGSLLRLPEGLLDQAISQIDDDQRRRKIRDRWNQAKSSAPAQP